MPDELPNLLDKLFKLVAEHEDVLESHIRLVWFSKTLQNYKALVIIDGLPNIYYEVTYNGDKHETYIDTYAKTDNVCIPD